MSFMSVLVRPFDNVYIVTQGDFHTMFLRQSILQKDISPLVTSTKSPRPFCNVHVVNQMSRVGTGRLGRDDGQNTYKNPKDHVVFM